MFVWGNINGVFIFRIRGNINVISAFGGNINVTNVIQTTAGGDSCLPHRRYLDFEMQTKPHAFFPNTNRELLTPDLKILLFTL